MIIAFGTRIRVGVKKTYTKIRSMPFVQWGLANSITKQKSIAKTIRQLSTKNVIVIFLYLSKGNLESQNNFLDLNKMVCNINVIKEAMQNKYVGKRAKSWLPSNPPSESTKFSTITISIKLKINAYSNIVSNIVKIYD